MYIYTCVYILCMYVPISRSLARPLSLEALLSLSSILAFFLAAIFGELLSECAGVEGAARLLLFVTLTLNTVAVTLTRLNSTGASLESI